MNFYHQLQDICSSKVTTDGIKKCVNKWVKLFKISKPNKGPMYRIQGVSKNQLKRESNTDRKIGKEYTNS